MPQKYVREEKIARQFGAAIKAIQLDDGILQWIKTVPKDSHKAEQPHHMEAIASLKDQYDKLQKRLDAIHVDKRTENSPENTMSRRAASGAKSRKSSHEKSKNTRMRIELT